MNRRASRETSRRTQASQPASKEERSRYHASLTTYAPRVAVADAALDLSLPALARALLIALAHVAAVVAALSLAGESRGVPALWPSTGLLLAALLLNERRQWALILSLVFLAHLVAGPILGSPLPGLGAGFAIAACVQAYVAAWMLSRTFRMPLALAGLPELLALTAAIASAGALGGLIEAALVIATAGAPAAWSTWRAWALADGLGMLAVTPALITWAALLREARELPSWRRVLESALAFLLLSLVAGALFSAPAVGTEPEAGAVSPAYLAFPILLWIAVRLGRPGASAAGLLLAGIAAWLTARGLGPFAAGSPVGLQAYLGVAILSSLALAVAVARRRRATVELRQAHTNLAAWARELELHNRQVGMLNRMGDLFQSCMTADDAFHVIGLVGPQLFPGKSGALYLMTAGHDQTWTAARWGSMRLPEAGFDRDDCLALRRRRLVAIGASRPGRPCRHVEPADGTPYLCVPLVALGEVVGVLHLRDVGPHASDDLDDTTIELARAAADSMALALGYVRLRHALREQSIRDPLTGLFNRRYMEETLDRELHRARRGGYSVGVIMLDLDRFKGFNDTFGHEAGDAALRDLGDYLLTRVRDGDIACRYGGEEFVVIMPNATPQVMRERAEQLREGIKAIQTRHAGEIIGPLSSSLGLATFPADGATSLEVLRAADAALFEAKRGGRDRVAVFEMREVVEVERK
jgi:diguanylate cyclase (GGDEF)-like protein